MYAYLWLDDRQMYMQQFLMYGRQLNMEELELVAMGDACAPDPVPPSLKNFQEQVSVDM